MTWIAPKCEYSTWLYTIHILMMHPTAMMHQNNACYWIVFVKRRRKNPPSSNWTATEKKNMVFDPFHGCTLHLKTIQNTVCTVYSNNLILNNPCCIKWAYLEFALFHSPIYADSWRRLWKFTWSDALPSSILFHFIAICAGVCVLHLFLLTSNYDHSTQKTFRSIFDSKWTDFPANWQLNFKVFAKVLVRTSETWLRFWICKFARKFSEDDLIMEVCAQRNRKTIHF